MKRNASSDRRRASSTGPPDRVELCGVVAEQCAELRSLLGPAIRFEVGTPSGAPAAVAHARRCEVVDLLRHLALDARDAMPAGGALTILAGSVCTDGAKASVCPALILREVRDDDPMRSTAPIRTGRSLGLDAACGVIEHAGGHLLVSCHGRETVVTICFPPAP